MKRTILISFVLLLLTASIMWWQGAALVTPASPNGIVDVEFARTGERLSMLKLFLDMDAVKINLYIDFIFIAAYGLFLYQSCLYIRKKTGWNRSATLFSTLSLMAAFFDAAENFILLLVIWGRFSEAGLQVVFYAALLKFILAGAVVLYLLFSWPFTLRRRTIN